MTRKILFMVRDYSATHLQSEDSAVLQELLENCADYFDMVYGLPPAASEAQVLLTETPPAKNPEDKFLVGLWDPGQKLIAVLDVVRDYPVLAEWFVGLLLVDPSYRQQGIGCKMYKAFEQWAIQRGAQYIGLGVVEQNKRAYDFWQRLGFEAQEKRLPKRYGNKENVVFVMKRSLRIDDA